VQKKLATSTQHLNDDGDEEDDDDDDTDRPEYTSGPAHTHTPI
jgi:hypothetical protein